MTLSFQEELYQRGMVKDVSDPAGLSHHLDTGRRRAYVGFDPTSTSLTVGNLLPIMLLRAFQRHGHQPVILCGGGTGLIGDPSGKSLERPLLTPADVEANVAAQRRIFDRLLDSEGEVAPVVLNNLDWLTGMSLLETLRDVGKHLSIFPMFGRETVKNRQAVGGFMSYAEFSYQLLQAYDFYYLHEHHGVTIQMGGSDQWGNITTGFELIRKMADGADVDVYGLTAPLLLNPDGSKMGKSELGAVYLTEDHTSPYLLYQYFVNLTDETAETLVPWMVDIPLDTVAEVLAEHRSDPAARIAQTHLARHVVTLLHGAETCASCEAASRIMFGGDVRELSRDALVTAFSHVPSVTVPTPDDLDFVQLLVDLGVAPSKSRVRGLIESGGIQVNGETFAPGATLSPDDLLHGEFTLVRRGKKEWYVIQFEPNGSR